MKFIFLFFLLISPNFSVRSYFYSYDAMPAHDEDYQKDCLPFELNHDKEFEDSTWHTWWRKADSDYTVWPDSLNSITWAHVGS